MNHHIQKVTEFNEIHMKNFSNSSLVRLVSDTSTSEEIRAKVLKFLQPWSDSFQRVIAMRVSCESDPSLRKLAQAHLIEEIGHNELLAKSGYSDSETSWDPTISAAASWFVDQMVILSGIGRAVLAHLVLEGSGLVFHQAGKNSFDGNQYFELHDEADQEHLEMGYDLLRERSDWTFEEIREVLDRGWRMITLLCDRVAFLANSTAT